MLRAVLALIAVTTAAHAEEPSCEVRVVRAPAEVRAAIEARVGIEGSCTKLDVRVIETRDGSYVVATPPAGEIFEGTVREPGLVGELVTSWARLPHGEPPDDEDEEPVVAEATPVPAVHVVAAPRARTTRDLALGMQLTDRGYGVRGELDVIAGRGFSLGIVLGAATSEWSYADAMIPNAQLAFRDLRAVVLAAKTWTGGAWRVRLQAGFGVVHTTYAGTVQSTPSVRAPVEGTGTTRMVEAAIAVSRDLAPSWALSLGPLLSYYAQEYELVSGALQMSPRRELDVAAMLTIRRRL